MDTNEQPEGIIVGMERIARFLGCTSDALRKRLERVRGSPLETVIRRDEDTGKAFVIRSELLHVLRSNPTLAELAATKARGSR